MKPTKPDRWERIANENALGKGENKFFFARDVASYLRKEHAAVVQLVRNHLSEWTDRTGPAIDAQEAYGRHCRAVQCREILDQLKRRAK